MLNSFVSFIFSTYLIFLRFADICYKYLHVIRTYLQTCTYYTYVCTICTDMLALKHTYMLDFHSYIFVFYFFKKAFCCYQNQLFALRPYENVLHIMHIYVHALFIFFAPHREFTIKYRATPER